MDNLNEINEDQLLGESPAADEAVSVEMQPDPAPVADEPTVPETPVPQADQSAAQVDEQTAFGRAMAAQRAEYEAKIELARQQAAQEAWLAAQRTLSQQQEQQHTEIPDPIVDPEGFAAWQNQREQAIAQRFETQLQAMQAQNSISLAQQMADLQKASTGYGWSEIVDAAWKEMLRVAPLMGADPNELAQYVKQSPDAGQRIMEWGRQGLTATGTAAPVDVEAIRAQAKAEALKELQAKASASPHNLAVPGVGSVPAQVVNEPKIVSEDEILAQ